MDLHALYHMLRLEVLHAKLFTLARDGPLPLMWKNLTTRSSTPLQSSELAALKNRTALIAGATSGCGLELAKVLAAHCTRLIITARDPQRGQQALEKIRKCLPDQTDTLNPQIDVWPLNLEIFQSIQEFTERLLCLPSLDIAVLNAGVWNVRFTRSSGDSDSDLEPYETHLQVNYLAPCALSLPILTVLSRGHHSHPHPRPGRLLNVTSEGHSFENIPTTNSASDLLASFNDPNALSGYQRYRLSKLLSMIWTHELASSSSASINSPTTRQVEIGTFTPGATQTQICRDLGSGPVVRMAMSLFCQSAELGAWTYVRAFAAEDFHGRYFFRGRECEPADCVTAEKYKVFRKDLVRQTVAVLGGRVSIPAGVYDWVGISGT
ncbi:hypothetical protein BJX99DRAFT_263382 [Aspergillus californicus]